MPRKLKTLEAPPNKLRIIEGPDPRTRKVTPDEPEAEAPPRPQYLDEAAREHWDRLAPAMVNAGTLTALDGGNLELYCQALSDVKRLTQQIREEGELIEGTRGTLQKNPRCLLLREAHDLVGKTAMQLGLSPTSRRRISPVPKKQAHDPWDDM